MCSVNAKVTSDAETGEIVLIQVVAPKAVAAGEVITVEKPNWYTKPMVNPTPTRPSKAWHEKPVTVLFALIGATLTTSLLAALFGALMWRLFSSIPF